MEKLGASSNCVNRSIKNMLTMIYEYVFFLKKII